MPNLWQIDSFSFSYLHHSFLVLQFLPTVFRRMRKVMFLLCQFTGGCGSCTLRALSPNYLLPPTYPTCPTSPHPLTSHPIPTLYPPLMSYRSIPALHPPPHTIAVTQIFCIEPFVMPLCPWLFSNLLSFFSKIYKIPWIIDINIEENPANLYVISIYSIAFQKYIQGYSLN